LSKLERLWDKLERVGIRPKRAQLEWISAAEAQEHTCPKYKSDSVRRVRER